MKSFSKVVTLAVLFLTFSFAAVYGQNMRKPSFNQIVEMAKQGNSQAQAVAGAFLFQQAVSIEDRDEEQANQMYAQAFHWFELAAKQNHPSAQHMLGVCYQYGKGVSQDIEKAVTWYTKGAENGDPLAQLRLGQCYHSGDGVQKNSKEALKWFSRSANRNVPEAQYWVGYYYENGLCGSNDYSMNLLEANRWYSKAAYGGYYPAAEAEFRTGIRNQQILEENIDREVRDVINYGRTYEPQGIITAHPDWSAAFPDYPQYNPGLDSYPYTNPYTDLYTAPYTDSYLNPYYPNTYPYNY